MIHLQDQEDAWAGKRAGPGNELLPSSGGRATSLVMIYSVIMILRSP